MSLDLILTTLSSALRPTDTTILLRHTTCSTSEPYANKSLLQMCHTSLEVSIEQLLHSMSVEKLIMQMVKAVVQLMKDSHVLMSGSERRA